MLDPDGLNVWSDQQLVGYLWRNTQGLIGFRYEEEWLAQGEFAVSHALPLQAEEFAPDRLSSSTRLRDLYHPAG